MIKAYNSKRKSLFFLGLLCICLIFFNTSCGLDVLDVVLEDPFSTDDSIPSSGSLFDKCTFSFSTSKLTEANDFATGYVYYKIYNSEQKKDNEKTQIGNLTADSSRKYTAYTYLIDNYRYKTLHYKTGRTDKEFSFGNKAQSIEIRLTNYDDNYYAIIKVDDNELGIPLRFNGKTFDFGRNGDNDEKPSKVVDAEENDSDVKGFVENGDDDSKTFYVVLYGIVIMPNDTFEKTIYSPVHYLGEVKINAADPNN